MSFGEDLRTYEDIHLHGVNLPAHLAPRVLRPRAVAVDPEDPRCREYACQRVFDALSAMPQGRELLIPAARASRRDTLLMAAMMAAQPLIPEVQHELGGTARTAGGPCARGTNEHRGESAPVDENQALLAASDRCAHRIEQSRRQAVDQRLAPGIDAADERQHRIYPVWQLQ